MEKEDMLIEIFCSVDDFCKEYKDYCDYCHKCLITDGKNEKILIPTTSMELSKIMTITIFFHQSGYRYFKWYYEEYVNKILKPYFPILLSYNRFVEVMQNTLIPLLLYTTKFRNYNCTGITFIDSTPIRVSHNKRIKSHKVFKDLAQTGKTSTGWFYGFKLHITINDKGEILSYYVTPGNTDDRNVKVIDSLTREIFGKLFGDKGYVSQDLFERLYGKSIILVTKLKKNMKNKLVDMKDKLLLRRRAIIESVNDFLKNICYIEHSRHRNRINFFVNLVSGIAAYSFIPKKPTLNL